MAGADAADLDDLERATAAFQEHRAILFGVAYRMVGQVSDAEDVVQEAWLRWATTARADVRDPRAFIHRRSVAPDVRRPSGRHRD